MNKYLEYIIPEIAIVSWIFLFGWICNFSEITNVLEHDIGFIIMCFGLVWFIGALGRIFFFTKYLVFSLINSFSVIIFGIMLHFIGLPLAFIITAGFLYFIFAKFCHFIDDQQTFIVIISSLFLIGFPLLIIGTSTNSKYLSGTQQFDTSDKTRQEKYDNDPNGIWGINFYYFYVDEGFPSEHIDQHPQKIKGTKQQVQEQASKISSEMLKEKKAVTKTELFRIDKSGDDLMGGL